jgi:anthranilate phosphoribosyltransferase
VLAGEQGAARDFAVANAAAAIMVGGGARTVKDRETETLSDCVAIAQEAIDSGATRRVLDQLVERSRELAGAEV